MPEYKSIEDLQEAMTQHEFAVNAYLQSKGWKYTSSTPGNVWLWERQWNNRTMLVNTATALTAQAWFDETAKPRSCNKHDDCDAADAKARSIGKDHAIHCYDDECEECFGS